MTDKIKCLLITGPTASGKSALAMQLAEHVPMEIIAADSAQVYRGMDIGTAKPSAEDQARVPHHLLDIRDPAESYSAAEFCKDAEEAAAAIAALGNLPVLVGGAMLYLRSLTRGLADLPEADPALRKTILEEAEAKGWEHLHQELAQRDPEAAARIHPTDPQRLQRAIEVQRLTGQTMTELHRVGTTPGRLSLTEVAIIPPDRTELNNDIATRFHEMLAAGLVEEVRALYERGDLNPSLPAIRAAGYRQLWQYLQGDLGYDAAVMRAIIATRQLAKRQCTWLRSWEGLRVIHTPDLSEVLKCLERASILGSIHASRDA